MDNSSPILVTIFVLTYKKFITIYDNLRSIVRQDYPCIELLVSDDGSGNFPLEGVEEFLQANCQENVLKWQVFANPKNVGTVRHINFLLSKAHGQLFIPLSADDEFYNNHVISEIVAEYNRIHFNVLSTSRVAVDPNGIKQYLYPHLLERIVIKRSIQTPNQQLCRLLQGRFCNFASGSTMSIRTAFLKQLGGHNENYILWEDAPFIAKITSMGYKIDYKLNMISVKYGLGGVSNGGAHGNVKTLFGKDSIQYKKDKLEYRKIIKDKLTLRFIEYDEFYTENSSYPKLLLWRIKYLDVFLLKKWHSCFERLALAFDKLYLRNHLLE